MRDVGAATAARAARCNPPLSIGARVLMEDDVQGGKIVECQVARYEGEAVAFHFPDGSRCRVGESVEEAAARAQNAQDKWAADQFGRQVRIQSRTVGGAVDATIVSFRDGLFTVQYYTANGHSRDKDIPLMKLRSLLGMSLRDPTSPPRGAREGKYSPLVGGRGARSPEALEPAEYYSPDTVQGQGVMDRQAHMRAGMEVARRHRGSPRARSPRQPDPTAAWVENHPVEGYEAESPGSTRVTRLERQLIRENEDLKRELQRLAAGDRHSQVYPTDGRPMGGPTSPRLPPPRPEYAEHYTAEQMQQLQQLQLIREAQMQPAFNGAPTQPTAAVGNSPGGAAPAQAQAPAPAPAPSSGVMGAIAGAAGAGLGMVANVADNELVQMGAGLVPGGAAAVKVASTVAKGGQKVAAAVEGAAQQVQPEPEPEPQPAAEPATAAISTGSATGSRRSVAWADAATVSPHPS